MIPLPKVELHLHLEGAMRSETVREMSHERMGWSGDLAAGWENTYYTFTNFAGFMAQLTPRFPWQPEEYRRIAAECFEDLAAQRVIYAEVSFDAPVRDPADPSRFWPIVEQLEEARREAQDRFPIRLNYIVGLQRSQPLEVAMMRVELAGEAKRRGMGVAGIDLHGDEENFPPGPFEPVFDRAEELGLGLRAHAGEAAGPESVWEAVRTLKVPRIGHGVRAVESPVLMEWMRRSGVTLEVCPTSNVRTGAVRDLRSHPVRRFYDYGILVTVNSDDPLPFFTNIEREYRLLVDEFAFTCNDLRVITENALKAAFLPQEERRQLLLVVEGAYRTAERKLAHPHP